MILLLGASGYIGQAFEKELVQRRRPFLTLARRTLDYTRFDLLLDFLQHLKPSFVINAAGCTGKPNVDACETARAETLLGNTLFPQTVAHACWAAGIPWGHVSSGCIFSGAKILLPTGAVEVEKDLTQPRLWSLVENHPERLLGFNESDAPNFSFRDPPCSFYSGSKALAEETLASFAQTHAYIWRLRIPFDEIDGPRNFLTKIQRYAKVYQNANSLSHRGDFARACLDLWERRAPFGIYNLTNPGFVTTRQVVQLIQRILNPPRPFHFWQDDHEFYRLGAATPRSNCILDAAKALATGISLRPVQEALEWSLQHWIPQAEQMPRPEANPQRPARTI